MRLVRVSDAYWNLDKDIVQSRVYFAVDREKRDIVKSGKSIVSMAESMNLYNMLEAIYPFYFRAFEGSFDIPELSDFRSNGLPKLKFTFGKVAEVCNKFYRKIFDEEIKILRDRDYIDEEWLEKVQYILDDKYFLDKVDRGDAFLLRIGRHSGAEAVTIEGVRNIKKMRGKGQEAVYEASSRTLWLASDKIKAKKGLIPFGWIIVEKAGKNKDIKDWPKFSKVFEFSIKKRKENFSLLEEEKKEVRKKYEEMLKRKIEQRKASEEREKQKAEFRKRLEAMDPEEREIVILRDLLRKKKEEGIKNKSGELADSTMKLIRKALEWKGERCIEVAELAEEVYTWIGWPSNKKKKKERKKPLEQLRDQGEIQQ
jgi:CRISPR-associated protein Csm5